MTRDQLRQVEDLFDELYPLGLAERIARLSAVKDPDVQAEVRSLLSHDCPDSGDLEGAVGSAVRAAAELDTLSSADVGPGTRLERYRLVKKLGQGGMGTVFSAVRDDLVFDKQVALKVLHLGMDSPASLDRFRQERQILATLEHPYIARLIDGGETASGLPYIVLEYVEGLPITEYCTHRQLNRDQRLALFLKVCEAVEYAHRNLIVHRDLKPANILVTEDGTPKLLDFGIAKLIDNNTQRTMTMFQALTPDYASPEQVRGQIITTASDVYSMGIVLFEILTDTRPYRISTMTPVEIERTVCETPPRRAGISEDLDNIIQMALRKESARRYGSVQQFAEDIERSLTHRPISARPDTIRYRTGKFVRRNWFTLAAVSLTMTAVVAGSAAALYQGRLAQQRFEQVRKLAHNYVFDLHDEIARIEGSTHARQMMVRTALEYLDSLSKTAGNDLELKRELASAYEKVGDAEGNPSKPSLGKAADAVNSYKKAEVLYRGIAEQKPVYLKDLADFYYQYGQLLRLTHDLQGSRIAADAAVNTSERVRSIQGESIAIDQTSAHAWCLLGDIDEDLQQFRASHDEYAHCQDLARKGINERRDTQSLNTAQGASERVGTTDIALGLLTEALHTFDEDEALIGELVKAEPLNPRFRRLEAILNQFRSIVYYDDSLPNFGDPAKSLVYAKRYLEFARAMHEKDVQDVSARVSFAIALFRLSIPLRELDAEAAVRASRESVAIFDDLVASGKPSYIVVSRRARALLRLGEALGKAGNREARQVAESALTLQSGFAANMPPKSEERFIEITARTSLGLACENEADWPRAEALLLESQAAAKRILDMDHDLLTARLALGQVETALGGFYTRKKDRASAAACYRRLVDLWKQAPQATEYVLLQREKAARSILE